MILPMRRVTVLALARERDALLEALQDLGAVELRVRSSEDRDETLDDARLAVTSVRRVREALRAAARSERAASEDGAASEALEVLPGLPAGGGRRGTTDPAGRHALDAIDGESLVARIAAGLERREAIDARIDALARTLASIAPLGAFEPDALRRLLGRGVEVRVLRAPSRARPEAPVGTVLREVARAGRHRYLAWVGSSASLGSAAPPEGTEPVPLPGASPSTLRDERRQLIEERQRLEGALTALGRRPEVMLALRREEVRRADRARFLEGRAALRRAGPLTLVQGFAPARDLERLRSAAAGSGWALHVEEIDDPAEAPTAIETPRWVRPVEAVLGLVGVVPGYGQPDVSAPFLVFFSLFFAMIVGDAGYGVLFLIGTELVRRLARPPHTVVALLRLLSVATIVWGALTGTWFGLDAVPHLLGHVQLPWLADPQNVMLLSFFIGAVHLSLAHLWNGLRAFPSLRALAQVGWVLVTWTMFFLARTLVLAAPFPSVMVAALSVGVILIVVFMTPLRALRSAWFEHAMLPLNLVSAFVDVVSYVRLFAVGAASFAVANAFDQMALASGLSGPLAGLAAAVILFLGHTLNILLATMGVLVHGVRLNTLEFAGHLGLEWSGRPFRPFRHEPPRGERA